MITGRRAFLGQLVRLPLIGGGVSLIGQPVAPAEPVTVELMYDYLAFLAREHWNACEEWHRLAYPGDELINPRVYPPPMYWVPHDVPEVAAVTSTPVASRAALVLAAAGVQRR